ncbi:hypothetical protein MCQ_01518 [Candidatus Bartonella washoeensis Sb944nv]|uniref:Uncharacterized protein n=2 Tax=Candidatus Bartonella washoeensis TaxID=186739 RepID=J0Q4B5_9HYPH|nr:hypothetical protein [Bartonella washoeensis]EJF77434.1 hypothetical protein MCQ_01518 [Bartonella washoeensis Sb944nv]
MMSPEEIRWGAKYITLIICNVVALYHVYYFYKKTQKLRDEVMEKDKIIYEKEKLIQKLSSSGGFYSSISE